MSQPPKCPKCGGTGRDEAATKIARRRECDPHMFIRCFNCAGNGWDPAELFRWGFHAS